MRVFVEKVVFLSREDKFFGFGIIISLGAILKKDLIFLNKKPISFVVCGAGRSGTSLPSSLIAAHPSIRIAHDSGIFFYMKLAIASVVANDLGKNSYSTQQLHGSIYKNDFSSNQNLKSSIAKLFDISPSNLLKSFGIESKIFEKYLYYLSRFWVHNCKVNDPTKDRLKADYFLSRIHPDSLLACKTLREALTSVLHSLASQGSLENNSGTDYPINDSYLYGEKTPDNCVCGDLINVYNPSIKLSISEEILYLYMSLKRNELTTLLRKHLVNGTSRFAPRVSLMGIKS